MLSGFLDWITTLLFACLVAVVVFLKSQRKMSGMNKLKTFLSIAHKVKNPGFGGNILQIAPPSPYTTLQAYSKEEKTLKCTWKVPASATMGNGELPLSALLAVIDDVTTWPLVSADAKCRPGVSVQLGAELIGNPEPIRVGSTLTFVAKATKVGATMGFTTCDVKNEDGDLICVGKHTKYLPMGRVYEIMMGNFMPVLSWYANNFGSKAGVDSVSDGESIGIDKVIGHEPEIKVSPALCNPMGGLHGGAQAIATEFAAKAKIPKGARLRSIDVAYMSTGKGTVVSEVNVREGTKFVRTVDVQIVRQKSGVVVSEARCVFDL